MGRDYPAYPLVGVGAIILDANRVVLVRRGRPPALGQWSLPGGIVELGETMEEAIVREVEEEVGLRVEVSQLVSVLDWILVDAAGAVEFHYVLMDFLCHPSGGALRAGSDVLSARLVPLESIPQYHLKRETMEVIDCASRCRAGRSACLYLRRRATTTEP
jgi:ADP-ribose pyrophosphatase YjhB (NUDIX family)